MKPQEERIREFMQMMTTATQETGITYAVQEGEPFVVFDALKEEVVNLDIEVGTEVVVEDGRTSITTFDKSNIENGDPAN